MKRSVQRVIFALLNLFVTFLLFNQPAIMFYLPNIVSVIREILGMTLFEFLVNSTSIVVREIEIIFRYGLGDYS